MSFHRTGRPTGMSASVQQITQGHASVGGVDMYWRSAGHGETPLVLVHGGFGVADVFDGLADQLAQRRRVLSVELQGHGRTPDIDRPFTFEAFGDDLAALVPELGLEQVDLLGYSLGAGACLRAAIQHPERVRRLVLLSAPCRRVGWLPDALANMAQVSSAGFAFMEQTPVYRAYAAVAPDAAGFPALMDKTGELLRRPYDWTEEVRALSVPTMLVYADADSVAISHAAEFYGLLGGGLRDAGWDGSQRPVSRLAVLPGRTHYDVLQAPELAATVESFLA